jgi:hypothetical protein
MQVILLFVSILTLIAQLQSNKIKQISGLEVVVANLLSIWTTNYNLPNILLKTNLTWSLQFVDTSTLGASIY